MLKRHSYLVFVVTAIACGGGGDGSSEDGGSAGQASLDGNSGGAAGAQEAEEAYPFDGLWEGETDAGAALSFTVYQGEITEFTMPVTFKYSGSSCSGEGTQSGSAAIEENHAELYVHLEAAGNGLDVALDFLTEDTAEGEIPAVENGGLICTDPAILIIGTTSTVAGPFTLTAHKVGAATGGTNSGTGGAGSSTEGTGGTTAVSVGDLGEDCSVLSDYCTTESSYCSWTVASCESGMCTGSPAAGHCSKACTSDADCSGGSVPMFCVTACTMSFAAGWCWDETTYALLVDDC